MEIFIQCTGGFTNRINSIIIGIFLYKYYPGSITKLHINWEPDSQCDANIESLFDIKDPNLHIVKSTEEFTNKKIILTKIWRQSRAVYKDQLHMPFSIVENIYNPHAFKKAGEIITLIKNTCKDTQLLYVSDPQVPQYVSYIPFFQTFKFKPHILQKVNQYNVDIGVHVRGTDILNKFKISMCDIDNYFKNLLAKYNSIFVCTDDKQIYDLCKKYNNIKTNNIINHVEKLSDSQNWYNHYGQDPKSVFNVYRSENQVVESIIDILTMAKLPNITGFVTSEDSTYYVFIQNCKQYKSIIFS